LKISYNIKTLLEKNLQNVGEYYLKLCEVFQKEFEIWTEANKSWVKLFFSHSENYTEKTENTGKSWAKLV